MEKVVRDGMVAVLYSPGFGAGWYTWHDIKELLFHPEVVNLVENDKQSEITQDYLKSLLGVEEDGYICDLGASNLKIEWLPEGTAFTIEEYDGSESIRTIEQLTIIA